MTDTPERTNVFYDAIDAFQRTHRLPGLQHAQLRGLLAEHLARVVPAAPAVVEPPADRAALRDRIAKALDNARHSHPCPVTGSTYWTGCYHPDGTSGSCHTNRRTDAVLAVLPEPANQTALHRIAEAALGAVEAALGDTLVPAAREEALAGIVAVLPEPADRAALRQPIAETLREHGMVHLGDQVPADEYDCCADAVLAVLPPPADRAELDSLGREADRLRKDWVEMRARTERVEAEVQRLRADRAAVLREAADALTPHLGTAGEAADGEMHDATILWAAALLRRMADETQPEPATACAHCGGDHSWDDCKAYTALVAANETQPAQAPAAEPEETDEQRADREETERDHARGDHTYCGITCEIEMPTEHLRNFVIAKGYPGTKGALDELERRAHAEAAAELPARIDRMRPEFTEHASIAAIDAQLDRARRQERRWHLRVEWLIGLRQARTEQPAAGARQDGAQR